MGVEDCIKRTEVHLSENETITEDGRVALLEAITHLKRALDTPGWQEWMTNGVSLPFEIGDAFPLATREAWSDSMDDNPDLIDAFSLLSLRKANIRGASLHDLHMAGWDSRARKWPDALKEMENLEKIAIRAQDVDKPSRAAANIPTSPSRKRVARKGGITRKNKTEQNLDEAAQNADRQVRYDSPRPLPETIQTRSWSAKVNFVLDTIQNAPLTDIFVVFGDTFELGHMKEALELFDIQLCV